jgi:hypothetical protein
MLLFFPMIRENDGSTASKGKADGRSRQRHSGGDVWDV